MPVSTINGPYSQAQMQGSIGFAYVFAQMQMQLELQDRMRLSGMGVVALQGDLAGSGSDTLRITDIGNVGFGVKFTALASETDTVPDSPIQLGYETLTVAQFALQQSETYLGQVLGREDAVTLDQLKTMVPESWEATFRGQVAATGAGITTAVGAATTTLSVDDHIDLSVVYRSNLGSRIPTALIDGVQFGQLSSSYRNEPAFQNSANEFAQAVAVVGGGPGDPNVVSQNYPNYMGQGINFLLTEDITQSGGARQGFAFSPGGIGWGVARTTPQNLTTANPANTTYLPEFGLIIEELTSGANQTIRRYRATSIFGTALGSERVFTMRRLISII